MNELCLSKDRLIITYNYFLKEYSHYLKHKQPENMYNAFASKWKKKQNRNPLKYYNRKRKPLAIKYPKYNEQNKEITQYVLKFKQLCVLTN